MSRSVWSLCPVELGTADGPLSTSVSEASTPFQTATQLASDLLTNNGDAKRAAPTPLRAFERQNSDVLLAPGFSTRNASTPSITTTVTLDAPLIPTSLPTYSRAPDPVPSDVTMIQAGPYSCTLGADLALLVQVLSEHLDSTKTNLNASTNMLTLNIHAAASPNDPAGSAQAPSDDQMPDSGSLLSSVIASNTSVYMVRVLRTGQVLLLRFFMLEFPFNAPQNISDIGLTFSIVYTRRTRVAAIRSEQLEKLVCCPA